MSGAALRVEQVTLRYGDRVALREVTLRADVGEVVALAGPNGSGKSSLLRAIVGIERSSDGSIALQGEETGRLPLRTLARRVGWMPQEEPSGDNLPVEDYVRYGRFPHIAPLASESDVDRNAVDRGLALAGASDLRQRPMWELSGGERQRARLARVLAQQTPILLLDEPTAHLDMGHQLDVLERVRAVARSERTAVVLAVHDLNLAARFADRVVVLFRGRVVADGTPRTVLSARLLREVWGVVAELRYDGASRIPYLIPQSVPREAQSSRPTGVVPRRVHVMAGGGSGGELLRRLVDQGYSTSTGVLPLFDSDAEAAEELRVPAALEVPFAPITIETRARLKELLAESAVVVVAPFPVGPANVANLEELVSMEHPSTIFLLPQPTSRPWDFTGGRATELRATLVLRGAREVAGVDELLAALGRGDVG